MTSSTYISTPCRKACIMSCGNFSSNPHVLYPSQTFLNALTCMCYVLWTISDFHEHPISTASNHLHVILLSQHQCHIPDLHSIYTHLIHVIHWNEIAFMIWIVTFLRGDLASTTNSGNIGTSKISSTHLILALRITNYTCQLGEFFCMPPDHQSWSMPK